MAAKFRNSRPKSTQTHTGDREFDRDRLQTRDVDDEPEKEQKASPGAHAGDLIDWLAGSILSPGFLMTLGYAGCGFSLAVGTLSYTILVTPFCVSTFGPFVGVTIAGSIGLLTAAALSLAVQGLEIMPRLPKYFPVLAERLAVKLALSRVAQPKPTSNTPSLLPEANRWAKNSHKALFAKAETASNCAYVLEVIGALNAFKLVTLAASGAIATNLSLPAVFGVIAATVGFELCLVFVSLVKQFRLTARESRKYNQLKANQRAEADIDLGLAQRAK
jgi:hypothetical protein